MVHFKALGIGLVLLALFGGFILLIEKCPKVGVATFILFLSWALGMAIMTAHDL